MYHLLTTGQKAEAEKLIFKTCNFRQCDDGNWTYLDVKQYAGRITGILYRYVQEKCPELTAQAEEAMDNIDYYMKCLNAHVSARLPENPAGQLMGERRR